MACTLCGRDEVMDAPGEVERTVPGKCEHTACFSCRRDWILDELRWSVPSGAVRCFGAGCPELMPQALVHRVCPESRDLRPGSEAVRPDLASQLRISTLKRSDASEAIVWPYRGKEIQCPSCGQQCFALLRNKPCHHAACEDCWISWAEKSATSCQAQCSRELTVRCIKAECGALVSPTLVNHAAKASDVIAGFHARVQSEVARLRRTADEVLVWGGASSAGGPLCPICKEQRFALVANPSCCHAACEKCWMTWCEEQLPRCRSQLLGKLSAPCLEPKCGCEMDAAIVKHVRTISAGAQEFLQELEAELARLRRCGGQTLAFGPCPSASGPECPVCRERCLALLGNPDCGHAACEDCWASWFATQLDHCRAERRVTVTCFAPRCQQPAALPIWAHAGTRNEAVRRLEGQLAFRRRLLANPLYPAEVQVECPSFGCVGLGYRGYDTVMCFICEHQWPADDGAGARPDGEEGLQMLLGEAMKQCPRCGEYIIKNGGCDHMTCRCRYEFWWSTLQPFPTPRPAPTA